jgi:predicted Holliday junction resolvase-like endonuclease
MDPVIGSIITIVFIVILMNFILLFLRLKKNRLRKPGKKVPEEWESVQWRDKEIQRRIDREQADAMRQFELRNNTLELYAEVRRRAAEREKEPETESGDQ